MWMSSNSQKWRVWWNSIGRWQMGTIISQICKFSPGMISKVSWEWYIRVQRFLFLLLFVFCREETQKMFYLIRKYVHAGGCWHFRLLVKVTRWHTRSLFFRTTWDSVSCLHIQEACPRHWWCSFYAFQFSMYSTCTSNV